MQLIVAVDSIIKTGVEAVAAAVVYPVNATAPVFQYTDKQGRRREVSLEDFSRLSECYQTNILSYLKRSSLSWAVIGRRDDNREAAMALAVARSLERLAYRRPDINMRRDMVRVVMVGKVPLPSEHIGHVQQELVSRGEKPWYVGAAYVLAKAPRGVPMMAA